MIRIVEHLGTGEFEEIVRSTVVTLGHARLRPAVWCLASGAWKRMLEAVRLDPLGHHNWRRAWRLLICVLMPTAVTRRLKALYGGWA